MERSGPRPSVTVVMPALDEEDGIVSALESSAASLRAIEGSGVLGSWEIVVVDDGSTDRTAELVRAVGGRLDGIRLVAHEVNRGVGAAVRTGLDVATGELLVLTDADLPVDLASLAALLPHLEDPGVGMVAGRRTSDGGEPRLRRLGTVAFDRLSQLLFGSIPPDVNFPLKVLPVSLARTLGLEIDGALADVELARRVAGAGRRIESVPVEYRARQTGRSKTFTVRVLGGLLADGVRHGRTLRRAGASPR